MIAIINYGLGNLGSIQNMLKRIGSTNHIITNNVSEIEQAEKIILPGVGAFDAGMEKIKNSGLFDSLNKAALIDKKPILGICLGMQLITNGSEEGFQKGFGWVDAYAYKFKFQNEQANLKVPHMGWNEVNFNKQHYLLDGLQQPSRFYFVHSYYVKCNKQEDVLMSCHYGIDFTCAVQHENIMGVQFHAEKSHKFGMQLLKNFASI